MNGIFCWYHLGFFMQGRQQVLNTGCVHFYVGGPVGPRKDRRYSSCGQLFRGLALGDLTREATYLEGPGNTPPLGWAVVPCLLSVDLEADPFSLTGWGFVAGTGSFPAASLPRT